MHGNWMQMNASNSDYRFLVITIYVACIIEQITFLKVEFCLKVKAKFSFFPAKIVLKTC